MGVVFGRDFLGVRDLDARLSTTDDDHALAIQYVDHKLRAGQLLDSSAAEGYVDWGCNVRQYCGRGFTDAQIAALGPTIAIGLASDPDGPVASAEVISRRSAPSIGPFEMTLTITIFTATGPLRMVADIALASIRMREN